MTIGERIKKLRLDQGLTQKQVADSCGMADSAIRKYESGKVTPKYEMLQRIAAALGVEWTELVPGEQQGQTVIEHMKGKIAEITEAEVNIDSDDEEILKVLLPQMSELDPLTDEEAALKTLLNSMGYNIMKTRGSYFFTYESGGSKISSDDLSELLRCTQNGLKIAAKTLELKLMQAALAPFSRAEPPQSPPAPQECTDTTPPPEGAEGPQEGE